MEHGHVGRDVLGERTAHAGRNPAGGWMVILLLAALISSGLSDRLTSLHATVFNGNALLAWVHIVAALYYRCAKRPTAPS